MTSIYRSAGEQSYSRHYSPQESLQPALPAQNGRLSVFWGGRTQKWLAAAETVVTDITLLPSGIVSAGDLVEGSSGHLNPGQSLETANSSPSPPMIASFPLFQACL